MDIDVLINKTRQKLPRLDVLINNAAIQGAIGPLWENDLDSWKKVINVNLIGPMALCRAFVPWMEANAGGSIINLSGGGATDRDQISLPTQAQKQPWFVSVKLLQRRLKLNPFQSIVLLQEP